MWLLILWILFAVFSAALAESKNRSVIGWGLAGLLFGPFGLLVAVFPPGEIREGRAGADNSRVGDGQQRSCPACRESIRHDARVCKHCGLQYPYLPEPARTHVGAIADLHRNGHSTAEIVVSLEGRGIRPTGRSAWTVGLIEEILRDHVT